MMSENEVKGTQESMQGKVIGWWIAILAIIAVLIWQAVQIRVLDGKVTTVTEQAAEDLAEAVANEQQTAAERAAMALAVAMRPILVERGMADSRIHDGTLNQVCTELANGSDYLLVAVTDPTGNVVAASNAIYVDKPMAGLTPNSANQQRSDDGWEAWQPVRHSGGVLGAVYVKLKTE